MTIIAVVETVMGFLSLWRDGESYHAPDECRCEVQARLVGVESTCHM
jgi:hypothetical protein